MIRSNLSVAQRDALRKLKHLALDLDGTIYADGIPFGVSLPFLEALGRLGIGHTFLTNNASRGRKMYLERLRRVGIDADDSRLWTSADCTIEWLRTRRPDVKRVFLLGTDSLADQFRGAGFNVCDDDPDDVPDMVIASFDTNLTASRLNRTAYWISLGLPYVATHPDYVCPTAKRTVLVDCGAICAALEPATGRRPEEVFGKPNPLMLSGILRHHGLAPENLGMVGDRLYTDVAMGISSGAVSILVLSGETTTADLAACDLVPDLVVGDVGELARLLEEARG